MWVAVQHLCPLLFFVLADDSIRPLGDTLIVL